MINSLWTYLLAALGYIAVVIIVYATGKTTGKNEAEIEKLEEDLEASNNRKKIDEEINTLGDTDLDDRLSKWVRK